MNIDILLLKAIEFGFTNNKSVEHHKYLLLCEIQKWLREKHNIHLLFDVDLLSKCWFYVISNILTLEVYDKDLDLKSVYYNTYEKALEEGIIKVLEYIEKNNIKPLQN